MAAFSCHPPGVSSRQAGGAAIGCDGHSPKGRRRPAADADAPAVGTVPSKAPQGAVPVVGATAPTLLKRRAPKKFVPGRGATVKAARGDGLAGEGPSACRAKRRAHGGGLLGCPALAQGRRGSRAMRGGAAPWKAVRSGPCRAAERGSPEGGVQPPTRSGGSFGR